MSLDLSAGKDSGQRAGTIGTGRRIVRWLLGRGRRRVLMLDGDPQSGASAVQAHWFLFQAGRPIDTACGTLDDPCPWASLRGDGPVDVVVRDVALDIERLASVGFASTPVGGWQRMWLMFQRRRDGDGGTLAWLGRSSCSDARAAVQGDASSPVWIDALAPLIGTGLSIATVSLPERLLAKDHPPRATPRFTVLQDVGYLRHVLIIDGVACFARRVPIPSDLQTMLREIVESLGHALDRWSVRRVALDLGEMPAELADAVEPALSGVPALVEMYRAPGVSAPGQTLPALAAGRTARRAESLVLRPLTVSWRQRVERRRLQGGIGLGCLMIAAVAVHASTVGIDKARMARSSLVETLSVQASLGLIREQLQALHDEPDRATHYLSEFDRLESPVALTPVPLLTGIARAVTRHPAIALDALAWSHRQAGASDRLDQAVYTDAADLPFAQHSDAGRLAIELSGRLLDAGALRESQAALALFIGDLGAHAALRDCRSLTSPLSAAAGGGASRGVAGQTDWRVRCVCEAPA